MIKNTLNVGQISEGFVLDHIQAGRSMDIYIWISWTAALRLSRMQRATRWGRKIS